MIIALTGLKRSGKDTAASFIQRRYRATTEDYDPTSSAPMEAPFIIYRFADPLKRALEGIYGWKPSIWDTDEKEVVDPFWGVSPRQAAQMMGTEWSILLADRFPEYAEKTGRKTYLKSFQRLYEEDPSKHYIIPDMRFAYEADAIRAMGGYTIRIRRPAAEKVVDGHASEQEIQTMFVDCEIINDGTLFEFERLIDCTLKSLKLQRLWI